jgi:hypothetical protein
MSLNGRVTRVKCDPVTYRDPGVSYIAAMCRGLISRGNRKEEFNGQNSSVADYIVQRGYLSGARDRSLSGRLFEVGSNDYCPCTS